jgi:hypothetical protein
MGLLKNENALFYGAKGVNVTTKIGGDIQWSNSIDLDFQEALILVKIDDGYTLINVFRWMNGEYYVDAPLLDMACDKFCCEKYDGLAIVECRT